MSPRDLAPWIFTAAAVAMAAWSWTRPVQTVETTRVVTEAGAPTTVVANTDTEAIAALVRETMRAELAEVDRSAARPVEMGPAVDPGAPVETDLDDALALVEDLGRQGPLGTEDRMEVQFALDSLHPEQRAAFMSAYFDALNAGDIVVHGSPL